MKRLSSFIIIFSIIFSFVLFNSNTFAQGKFGKVGKTLSIEEANQQFGPVLNKFRINKHRLLALTKRAPEYIMFGIVNNQLVITNAKREVVFPDHIPSVAKEHIFHLYSTSVVEDFLNSNDVQDISVETRANDIMTLTAEGSSNISANVLEFSAACPPLCD